MSQETAVRRSLHAAAEDVAVPPVDVAALRAAGRREGRRRMAVAALTAAAVLAVVVGSGIALTADDGRRADPDPVQRTERPEPTPTPEMPQPVTIEDLPHGEPGRVPAASGGVLYTPGMFTDMEQRGRIRELTLNGGVALGVHTVRGIVRVTPDGHFVDLGAEGHDLAVSSNGRWAAWLLAGRGQARVMLWDLTHGEIEEIRTLPLRGSCCDDPVRLNGVDNAGRVYVSSASEGTFMWDHRTAAVTRMDMLQGIAVTQVTVDDVVLRSPPEEKGVLPRYTIGRVDASGTFIGEQLVSGYDVRWSPDLSRPARIVQPGAGPVQVGGDRIEVLDPSTGKWRPMLVPSEVSLHGYIWEDGGHLLVTVVDSKERFAWLRCSAIGGTCERASGIGPAGDWVIAER